MLASLIHLGGESVSIRLPTGCLVLVVRTDERMRANYRSSNPRRCAFVEGERQLPNVRSTDRLWQGLRLRLRLRTRKPDFLYGSMTWHEPHCRKTAPVRRSVHQRVSGIGQHLPLASLLIAGRVVQHRATPNEPALSY